MPLGFTIDTTNQFNAIFAPLAKIIALQLIQKEVHVFYSDLNIEQKLPRLIFGAHSNPNFWLINKKDNDIFFNLEDVKLYESKYIDTGYFKLLDESRVLDYSSQTKQLIKQAEFFSLHPLYKSTENLPKDKDVLFVGSINERRKSIFKQLSSKGIRISYKMKIFGQELFQEIEKAKIYFCCKFHDDAQFNIYRFCLCADSNTIYVGESGNCIDYSEVEELKGKTIANNPDQLSKIIQKIIYDEKYREYVLKIQKNIAKKLQNKFQKFIGEFSREFH